MLILASVTAWVAKRGTDGILACQAALYTPNRYLAYCDAAGYGDYDHGAVWFDLEPGVQERAAAADVLFLGDSRMQFAFSTHATANWFSSVPAQYYLWGFAYRENALFAQALLNKARPRAGVYVINADPFFERTATEPAGLVLRSSRAKFRYREKQFWQVVHEQLCSEAPLVCGNQYAIFRARDTGAWSASGADRFTGSPVSDIETVSPEKIADYVTSASEFLSHLPVQRECVILTVAPTSTRGSGTRAGTALAIATALKMKLIAPTLDGLQTFDGIHLDGQSAERWSAAFFDAAAPQILRCLSSSVNVRAGLEDPAATR